MRSRTPVSLFPFLSVLLSTMGVLSFLAVTFSMYGRPDAGARAQGEPVEVRWVGAPSHVRPLLLECLEDSVVVHSQAGGPRLAYDKPALEREVEVVRELLEQGYQRFGPTPSSTQLWLFFKESIGTEGRLAGSFTQQLHALEISNLRGRNQQDRVERYPILLVYPDGVGVYDLVSYLIETTTRLSLGLEPMLKGWQLPYREFSAG